LRRILRERPGEAAVVYREAEWAWAASETAEVYVRILDGDGQPVAETPGMDQVLPPEAYPAPFVADALLGPGTDVRSPEGRPFRVVAAQVGEHRSGQPSYVVQVALDRTHEEGILSRFRAIAWGLLAVAFLVLVVGGYQIGRRGIGKVRKITRTARRIRATTLNERIAATNLPEELAELAETFNEMLDRLEEAFGRLARFSADIAHELRTPIARLRGEAEVTLNKLRSPDEYREVVSSFLEECVRLSRMIDSLLFLARAEHPQTQIEKDPIEIGRELAAVQEFYEAKATDAGVRLTVAVPEPLVAHLNRSLFQRAIGNLVDNALMHTPAGGAITLRAVREAQEVCIEVADTGCGIPEAHRSHLFDRFYRVNRSHSSDTGGVGLGLAIVQSIAELHGGSVTLTSEVGHGTRVALHFPSPTSPSKAPGGEPRREP
jgi:two-component system heavy metal sensor histidine kinase CusS